MEKEIERLSLISNRSPEQEDKLQESIKSLENIKQNNLLEDRETADIMLILFLGMLGLIMIVVIFYFYDKKH